jgi:hypothetical protein
MGPIHCLQTPSWLGKNNVGAWPGAGDSPTARFWLSRRQPRCWAGFKSVKFRVVRYCRGTRRGCYPKEPWAKPSRNGIGRNPVRHLGQNPLQMAFFESHEASYWLGRVGRRVRREPARPRAHQHGLLELDPKLLFPGLAASSRSAGLCIALDSFSAACSSSVIFLRN